jgi:hypothetical protein
MSRFLKKEEAKYDQQLSKLNALLEEKKKKKVELKLKKKEEVQKNEE